jgi:hypothetical protein
MALSVTIAGNDWTPQARVETLQLNDRLNSRSRASLQVIVRAADILITQDGLSFITQSGTVLIPPSLAPIDETDSSVGAEIVINDGATVVFGGLIDSYNEEVIIDGNLLAVQRDIEAVSYDALADRRLVAASYESGTQTLFDIVDDVATNHLTGDGIDTSEVDTGGMVIPKIKFDYLPAAAVFNELASITGWAWWIDDAKKLHFKPRSETVAPFAVDEDNARDIRLTTSTDTYRNRQFIRAGVALTNSRTETFAGDGERKAFTLSFPAGAKPSAVSVDGSAKTIGIRGVETGFDFYWNAGDPVISQDDGAAVLTSANVLSVTYQGQYPILIQAQDDTQIGALAAVSGAAGIIDEITNRAAITAIDTAQTLAAGLLRRYGKIPRRVTFETDTGGLAAGQLVTITIPTHGVSGSWLIDQVSARDRFGQSLVYTVEALDGENVGGWEAFFSALSREGRVVEFRENEVIVLLRIASETVTFTDSLAVSTGAPESRVGFALVGFSEVGT